MPLNAIYFGVRQLVQKEVTKKTPALKNRQWLREFCAKQENRPAAYSAYVRSDLSLGGAKFTNQNPSKNKKSSMMRLFLCEARERKRSILGVCEHFAIRRFVQKELIRETSALKNRQWLREFCAKQENRPAAYSAYVRSDLSLGGAKFTNQNPSKNKKSSMMRLFLCEARERKRSILGVCEHFGIRRLVQKELIRTIFQKKMRSSEVIRLTGEHLPQS